jgi:hypothetical protein
MNEIVLPAAKVITTAFGLIEPLISSRTVAMSCGFTTNKSASASETLVLRIAALIEYFEIRFKQVCYIINERKFSNVKSKGVRLK